MSEPDSALPPEERLEEARDLRRRGLMTKAQFEAVVRASCIAMKEARTS